MYAHFNFYFTCIIIRELRIYLIFVSVLCFKTLMYESYTCLLLCIYVYQF